MLVFIIVTIHLLKMTEKSTSFRILSIFRKLLVIAFLIHIHTVAQASYGEMDSHCCRCILSTYSKIIVKILFTDCAPN